jgi:hypothetical protein
LFRNKLARFDTHLTPLSAQSQTAAYPKYTQKRAIKVDIQASHCTSYGHFIKESFANHLVIAKCLFSTYTGERRLKEDHVFEALGTTDELSISNGVM